jgi:hypothetical protein
MLTIHGNFLLIYHGKPSAAWPQPKGLFVTYVLFVVSIFFKE